MEFDKDKVFTALNADELKIGSKVIVAYSIGTLKERVVEYPKGGDTYVTVIKNIEIEKCENRFETSVSINDSIAKCYPLAYLISEPDNSVKCKDLKIGDIISSRNLDYMVLGINRSGGIVSDVFLPCIGWRNDKDLENFYKKI